MILLLLARPKLSLLGLTSPVKRIINYEALSFRHITSIQVDNCQIDNTQQNLFKTLWIMNTFYVALLPCYKGLWEGVICGSHGKLGRLVLTDLILIQVIPKD